MEKVQVTKHQKGKIVSENKKPSFCKEDPTVHRCWKASK